MTRRRTARGTDTGGNTLTGADHDIRAGVVDVRDIGGTSTLAIVWDDLADAVDDIINSDRILSSVLDNDNNNDERTTWAGSRTMSDALDMLRNGWGDHRADVERVLATLQADPEIQMTRKSMTARRYDVAGASVNVGRYLAGDPRCMARRTRVTRTAPAPVVRIVIDGTASASVDPDKIVARGIAVVALVAAVELLGKSCELWWAESTSSYNYVASANAVRIKAADEPIDVDDLLFATAHPSMLRRFGFALWNLVGGDDAKKLTLAPFGGYGNPRKLNAEQWSEVIGRDVAIVFGGMTHGEDFSDPMGHVRRHLAGLHLLDA